QKAFPTSCLAPRASQLTPNCGRRSKKKSRTRRKGAARGAGQHGKLENCRGDMKQLVVTTRTLGIIRIKRRRELRKRKKGIRMMRKRDKQGRLEINQSLPMADFLIGNDCKLSKATKKKKSISKHLYLSILSDWPPIISHISVPNVFHLNSGKQSRSHKQTCQRSRHASHLDDELPV
ncbi:hypothetical protein D0862_08002, partial [Hortaea werneckii]